MSSVDLNNITFLSSTDIRLLEYDRVKKIESENNFLKIGIICLVGLSIAYTVYIAYQEKKIKSKEFRNNYID